jgi:hypothetical protein
VGVLAYYQAAGTYREAGANAWTTPGESKEANVSELVIKYAPMRIYLYTDDWETELLNYEGTPPDVGDRVAIEVWPTLSTTARYVVVERALFMRVLGGQLTPKFDILLRET